MLVFAFEAFRYFAVLQSTIHFVWALANGSPRGGSLRYKIKPCFESFPFPTLLTEGLDVIGEQYFQNRQSVMEERQEGINELYNRVHDSEENSDDVRRIRELHAEMDRAVVAAYGWQSIALDHGFYDTPQGVRFTVNETARREIFQQLLRLNHERYEEEMKQGLERKNRKKTKKQPIKKTATATYHVPDILGLDEQT